MLAKLKAFSEMFSEEEIRNDLEESNPDMSSEIDFEGFLKVSFFDLFLLPNLIFYKLRRIGEIWLMIIMPVYIGCCFSVDGKT